MAFNLKRRDFLLAMGAGPGLASTMSLGVARGALGTSVGGESHWGGMQIEGVVDEPRRVVVETTGAVFAISREDPARIEITQKINGPRELCVMDLHTSFENLTLDFHDGTDCILYVPGDDRGFNIRVYSDSLLSIRVGPRVVKEDGRLGKELDSGSPHLHYEETVPIETHGKWLPDYSYSEAGDLFFLDKRGGYGQYVIPSAPPSGGVFEKPDAGLSFSDRGWMTYSNLSARKTMLVCVAPPRAFDWRKSIEDRIVHHFIADKREDGTWNPYPSDSQIEEYARYGNVLGLHYWSRGAGPMRGKEVASRVDIYAKAAPWAAWRHEPLDAHELARVVNTAHRLGIRVLPYTSPLYFPGNAREFLWEMERLLETHNFDGMYFDGVSGDIQEGYEIMKGARRLLGDRLLYVHVPSPILGTSYHRGRYVYCPFIDTYADFILRAEHIDTFDDLVLRYTISSYNISNAIGCVCNYDYNLSFNRELILKALDYNVRVPYWAGFDIYLKDRGKDLGVTYPSMDQLHEIMIKSYFPTLDRLREKHPEH